MRKFVFLASIVFSFFFPFALCADVSGDFVRARRLVSQADAFAKEGDNTSAREFYSKALERLQVIREAAPDWDPEPVEDQINYCNERLTQNKTDASKSVAEVKPPVPQLKEMPSSSRTSDRDQADASQRELSKARLQIESLQEENQSLKKKLEDSERGLAEGRASHREKEGLSNENQKLKEALELAQTRLKVLVDEGTSLKRKLDESGELRSKYEGLQKEAENLKQKLARMDEARAQEGRLQSEHNALQRAHEELKKASELSAQRLDAFSEENKSLKEKLEKGRNTSETLAALQKENELLKSENHDLKGASDRLRLLSEQNETFKERLNRVDEFQARVRQLEKENETLRSLKEAVQMAAANQESSSSEEDPEIKARNAKWAAEAKRLYANREFDAAAGKYERILRSDPENVTALSNLGIIRLRQNKLAEAEKHLRAVLAIDPQDGFSLSVLGIAYYRQNKYDAAISALTRAITIDPKNYEAHNYLGITYHQKGYREAAEKELLKAVQLKPDYADAHFNLAVVYARQNPPSIVSARKEYKRARTLGMPSNAEIEKLLK